MQKKLKIIKKRKILHVDDEQDTLDVVRVILEKEGYEVLSVNNGKKALKEIYIDGFDLLIFDIMMPDMSGWKLFGKISKIKPKYKVVFLSILDLSKVSFTYEQQSSSTIWMVTHNLGYRPAVFITDYTKNTLEGDISHTSNNALVITFTDSVVGYAYLS